MDDWPPLKVERVLRLVQGCDPIGVAARGLQELPDLLPRVKPVLMRELDSSSDRSAVLG